MEIRIKELCEMRGIESAYRLAKESGLNMPTAYRAFEDDIKQFTPETLEKLCNALQCSPNDIFGYDPKSIKTDAEKVRVYGKVGRPKNAVE